MWGKKRISDAEIRARDRAAKRIKEALESRSRRAWAVRCGRGPTALAIFLDAPESRRNYDVDGVRPVDAFGYSSKGDREELGRLLGREPAPSMGIRVDPRDYDEYALRAEGRWTGQDPGASDRGAQLGLFV